MRDLRNKIFLSQNPIVLWGDLKKKNYKMTQLIEQTLYTLFSGQKSWIKSLQTGLFSLKNILN